jgi:hypothetical protein
MLHKDYDLKGSFFGPNAQGARHQDKLISGKPPVLNYL